MPAEQSRQKELQGINRKIIKIDAAFAPAIKNLTPCTFGLEKPKVSHYQSLVRSVIAQQVSTAEREQLPDD
jgi:3-methyladenine DNA glycosylase/8-oxoguanine DNA glycosylase